MIARLLSRSALIATLLGTAACVSDLSLPSDPKLLCTSDADCPNGLVCNVGHVCVPSSFKDQPAPDLQSAPSVTPTAGMAGTTFEIAILATQPMRGGPTVVLHLSPAVTLEGSACDFSTDDPLRATCRYTATGAENGGLGGAVAFDVLLENELRATTTKAFAGVLLLDYQAPSVVARVSPSVVSSGDTLLVDLLLSEPVRSAPVLRAVGPAGEQLSLAFENTVRVSSTQYTFTHAVTPEDPSGAIRFLTDVTDLAGNVATNQDAGSVTVLSQPPRILSIEVDTSVDTGGILQRTFSAVPGFNILKLDIRTNQSFDVAPASLNVAVGGRVLPRDACSSYQERPEGSTLPNYTCTFTVTPSLRAQDGITPLTQLEYEEEPITVWATTAAGSRTSASALPVIFDLRKPTIVAGSASTTIVPPASSTLTHPTALTVGSTARVRFTVSEPLRLTPDVATSSGSLTFSEASIESPTYSYEALLRQPGNDGTYVVQTILMDTAGNDSGLQYVGSVTVDTTVPAAPNTTSSTAITYTRAPWGMQDGPSPTSAPYFAVSGLDGAVEPNAWIRLYDGANPATATRIYQSETRADANGAFGPITLTAVDRPNVFLSVADDAGNSSVVKAVQNVKWVGSLRGTISTQLPSNPTLVVASPAFSPALEPESFQATAVAPGQSSFVASGRGVWRPVALGTVSPAARAGASVAFDTQRGVAVLVGGDDSTGPQSDTWEWDGSSWTRRSIPGPAARTHAASAYNRRLGKVVLFGGWSGGELGDTWLYDGLRWTLWQPTSGVAMPQARRDATLTYSSARGTVVLFGGRTGNTPLNDLWEFDGTRWSAVTTGTPPPARAGHTLTYTPSSDKFLLFGGLSGSGQALQDAWELAPSPTGDWTWAQLQPATKPPARDQHVAFHDPATGTVLVVGGRSASGTALGDVWRWTGTSSNWSELTAASLTAGRFAAAVTYDAVRTEAVLFGGSATGGARLGETWAFNGTRWTEATPSVSPPAREAQAIAYDENRGQTVMFGGTDGSGTALGTTWTWNGRRWSQPSLGTQPPARSHASMTWDRVRGKLVLFGGQAADGQPLADTWEWDGSAAGWVDVTPATSPPARRAASLGFWCAKATSGTGCDATTAVAILVGGLDASDAPLSDTWTWNGSTWTSRAPIRLGRAYSAIAFDTARFRTVVFGGLEGTGSAVAADNETFEWNGSLWLRSGVTNPPPARYGHSLGYDAARGRVVLFSGKNASGLPLVDDWTWDGTSWSPDLRFCVNGLPQQGVCDATGTPISIVPPGRSFARGTYDTARNRFVVFGGAGVNGVLGDTWELANTPASSPAAMVTFDFASTGNTAVSLLQPWAPYATVGGTGYALTVPGTGTPAVGARLLVWDFWSGSWVVVGSNAAPASAPSAVTPSSSLPLPGRIIGSDGKIRFAVAPTSGQGNGGAGSVGVQDLQLTMNYRIQ